MKKTMLLAAVLTALVGLTGCTAPATLAPGHTAAATPQPTHTPTPTVTVTPGPVAAPTPGHTLNGFDLSQVYAACDAAVPDSDWGGGARVSPQPPTADSFGIAANEPYVKDTAAADPNAIYVNVVYEGRWSALCTVTGDPASPTVTYVRSLD